MDPSEHTLARTLTLKSVVLFGLAYMTPLIVLGTFGVVADTTGGAVPDGLSRSPCAPCCSPRTATGRWRPPTRSPARRTPTSGGAIDGRVGLPRRLGDAARLLLPAHGHLAHRRRLPAGAVPRRPRSGCGSSASSSLTTALNVRGIKTAERVNDLLMVFQFLVIAFFVLLSLRHVVQLGGGGRARRHHAVLPTTPRPWPASRRAPPSRPTPSSASTRSPPSPRRPSSRSGPCPAPSCSSRSSAAASSSSVAYATQLVHPGSVVHRLPTPRPSRSPRPSAATCSRRSSSPGLVVAQFASGIAAQASTSRLLFAMGRDSVLPRRHLRLRSTRASAPPSSTSCSPAPSA